MSLSNPLAWFAICALCLLIGAALSHTSAFYRQRQEDASASRFAEVDGLRGFLALGVFGAHAVNMYTLHTMDVWAAGIAPFYVLTARAGVALFFMITGFLFWLRVLRSEGRLDSRALFVSRLRRLTPMYAMSVLMALAVIAAASGFVPHSGLAELARELRPWLSFGFMETGAINGVPEARYINAVYWTLAYEWMFYVALPLLALFARWPGSLALLAAVVVFGTQAPIVFNFLFGAIAATLVHRRTLGRRLDSPWLAPLPVGALVLYFMAPDMHGLLQAAVLFAFFVFVVHGYSLLGLLRTGPAKVLGTISYSLYLIHCIALFVTVRAVDSLVPIASLEPLEYWLLAALAAAASVLLSACTYRYVEHPFLRSQNPSRRQAHEYASV